MWQRGRIIRGAWLAVLVVAIFADQTCIALARATGAVLVRPA